MKSYTDLNQSKKLAEILPLESADMYYCYGMNIHTKGWSFDSTPTIIDNSNRIDVHADIPCWSLTALLDVLPIVYINNKKEICGPLHIDITDSETPFVLWYVNPLHKGSIVELKTKEYDNMIDACYEMIIKLNELKML